MDRVGLVLLLGWGSLALVWLVGAFRTARTVRRAPGWGRLLFSLVFLAVYLMVRFAPGSTLATARFVGPTDAAFAAGTALLALGVALAIWARVHLGRFWSGRVTLKEGHRLVQSGPYAVVRNPIYTGILLAALGAAVLTGRVFVLAMFAFLVVGFLLKVRAEEHLLAASFGAEFADYKNRVKRLVPWVW